MTEYIVTDRNGRKKRIIEAVNMDTLRLKLMIDPPGTSVLIAKVMEDGRRRTVGLFSGDADNGFVWRSEPLLDGTSIDPYTGAIASR